MKDFQDYIEPEEGCQGSPQRRGPLTSGPDEENVALPLGDNVLTHNLGIPVLVVCTKVCARELYAWLGLASEQSLKKLRVHCIYQDRKYCHLNIAARNMTFRLLTA